MIVNGILYKLIQSFHIVFVKYDIFSNCTLHFFFFFVLALENLHLRVVLLCFKAVIKWRARRGGGGACLDRKSWRSDGWSVGASRSARTLPNGNTFLRHERKTIRRQSSSSTQGMKRLHKRPLSFFLFTLHSCQTLYPTRLTLAEDWQTSMGVSLRLPRHLNSLCQKFNFNLKLRRRSEPSAAVPDFAPLLLLFFFLSALWLFF